MAEPKTEEQLNFLTSLAYVEEMATGVQGQIYMTQFKIEFTYMRPTVIAKI